MIYSLDTKVRTRKYRYHDMTLKQAIDNDISYVKWMHANKKIVMDDEALDYLCEKNGKPRKTNYSGARKMM